MPSPSSGRTRWPTWRTAIGPVVGMLFLAACAAPAAAPEETTSVTTAPVVTTAPDAPAGCADVVDVEIEQTGDSYRVSATVRSADTGWDKYADAWEVRAPDGTVLGTRVLAHPHVDEQPFTRSLGDVSIPPTITTVEVAARDSVAGFCGATFEADVPRS